MNVSSSGEPRSGTAVVFRFRRFPATGNLDPSPGPPLPRDGADLIHLQLLIPSEP